MKVECPYKEKCSDADKLCESCRHNELRSYYEPIKYWDPYPAPPYPYYEGTGDDLRTITTSNKV